MKALVHSAPFRLDYTRAPVPSYGPSDVLVRVKAVGICGSDVQGYSGRTGRRIPPVILGHEAAGIVEETGKNVEDLPRGTHVCFDSTIYCNTCNACRQGQVNYCGQREVLGVSIPGMKRHGAMAEFVCLPWWTLIRMPSDLSFAEAALLEPVSVGLHAVSRAAIAAGETVLIIGAGTIGLFILQAARLNRAGKIIVSDPNEHRLQLAQKLGADVTLSPENEDIETHIHRETAGRGVDVSFEVVGFASTLQDAIHATRMGGRVILVGNLTKSTELHIPDIISRELTLRGTYCNAGEYREAITLVTEKKILALPLVSATLPLAEGQEAFDRLYRGEERNLLKILLIPS